MSMGGTINTCQCYVCVDDRAAKAQAEAWIATFASSGQEAKAEAPVAPPATFEERVVALAKVLIENDPDHANDFAGYSWKDAIEQATGIIAYVNTEETCTCD